MQESPPVWRLVPLWQYGRWTKDASAMEAGWRRRQLVAGQNTFNVCAPLSRCQSSHKFASQCAWPYFCHNLHSINVSKTKEIHFTASVEYAVVVTNHGNTKIPKLGYCTHFSRHQAEEYAKDPGIWKTPPLCPQAFHRWTSHVQKRQDFPENKKTDHHIRHQQHGGRKYNWQPYNLRKLTCSKIFLSNTGIIHKSMSSFESNLGAQPTVP